MTGLVTTFIIFVVSLTMQFIYYFSFIAPLFWLLWPTALFSVETNALSTARMTSISLKGPLQPKIFISEHDVIRPPDNESVIIFFISLTVL